MAEPGVAEPGPAVLRFAGADLGYHRAATVIRGVDFALAAGRAVALLGANGSGKSTVIKAAVGLARVVRGTVEMQGQAAYVPQLDTLDPDFPVSAAAVVLMGRYRAATWWRPTSRADRRLAAQALDRVGLADRAGVRFGLLSGGQRQRVLIARGLAARPGLLLLDEPFNGVDGDSRQAVVQVLDELRAAGTAIVLSTHDERWAHRWADQVLWLGDGTARV
jgi:manganese/iron transport system ATP-binding protein